MIVVLFCWGGLPRKHNNEQLLVDYTIIAAGGNDNTATAINTNGRCTPGASNGGARGDPWIEHDAK